MPRLPLSLLLRARQLDPLLVPLLKTCRDLPSARNEFRWLKAHIHDIFRESRTSDGDKNAPRSGVRATAQRALLRQLCHDRGWGKPLQYILRTAWFGELEIHCGPGVLVPRPETAAITTYLAHHLLHNRSAVLPTLLPAETQTNPDGTASSVEPDTRHLRILDLCTGTGCISLLLSHLLRRSFNTHILGIDISSQAVRLACRNKALVSAEHWHDLPSHTRSVINFARADIMSNTSTLKTHRAVPALSDVLATRHDKTWDILVANPPYISPQAYHNGTTARSVRLFEPREALVPLSTAGSESATPSDDAAGIAQADAFYPRLLQVAVDVGAKVVLLEVGDESQAMRVASLVLGSGIWQGVEVWYDGAEAVEWDGEVSQEYRTVLADGKELDVRVIGRDSSDAQGPREGRAVLCWRSEGAEWLGKPS